MTTNIKDEALKLALEALEVATTPLAKDRQEVLRAITAIREALADHIGDANKMVEQSTCKQALQVEQPAPVAKPHEQQEPVAWGVDWGKAGDQSCVSIIKRLPGGGIEVLATEYGPQPSKPWWGLTEEEMKEALASVDAETKRLPPGFRAFAEAIEAKLREKNA